MSKRNLSEVLAQMADLPEFVEIPGLGLFVRSQGSRFQGSAAPQLDRP